MASSSRTQVLNLYKIMLRESQKFSSYNYRTYAIRRIRDAFREKKNIDDFHEVQTLVYQAKDNLDIIRRQASIGHLYATQKLVIESSESQ
ncbi:LYR motif-containing protein 4 [Rana temporaria]|uniref:LYR motif-containing protein 4 n=1 Tax=Rana temporaria TaxID=8407 RepID=UPI001AAC5288|nr:LYR motif-containing protein 4 [Rana temporaria]